MKYLGYISFYLLVCALSFGCMSNKKHLAALENQEVELEALRRGQVQKMNRKVKMLQDSLQSYQLQTATKAGSIATLENLRKELEKKNRALEDEIESISSQSANSQQSLNSNLSKKDNEIADLKNKIAEINKILESEVIGLGTLTGDLRPALGLADPNKYELISSKEALIISFNEELLFGKGRVSKLSSDGATLMEQITGVLNQFPAMNYEVIGHTDNGKPIGGYKDNLVVSSIRAIAVVNAMLENGISSGQITASGKGAFAPAASNQDEMGKNKNRRVEIKCVPSSLNLAQQIKRIIN